ncbi:protein-serine,threonine phosphatase [Sarracenia purpurea var. burkii]
MPLACKQLPQLTTVVKPFIQIGPPETCLQSSPAREEGEVPESELDPDTRRRLLILQHGQDTRDHAFGERQFPVRPPLQVSVPLVQAHGSRFRVEEEMSPKLLNRVLPPKESPLNSEAMHAEKHRSRQLFVNKMESSISSDRVLESQRLPKEALQREDRLRMSHSLSSNHSFSGEELPLSRSPSRSRELDVELGQVDPYVETPSGTLQDIAVTCGTEVEFKSALVSSMELQFSVEVLFAGEKIGEGIGRTRREAHHQAAEESLMNLADKYLSRLKPDSSSLHGEGVRFSNANSNGFISCVGSLGHHTLPKEELPLLSGASEPPRVLGPRLESSKKSMCSVSALKEFCMMEGLVVAFQAESQSLANPIQKNEVYAQVEVDGQVLGTGVGLTWDEAKMQAAEKALGSLKSMLGQFSQKRQGSPR